jgi:hypothetical protein
MTEELANAPAPNEAIPPLQLRAIMAVFAEMQNTGDPAVRSEIVASIEHALYELPGDWRISLNGSRASDDWEIKVEGPRGFERMHTLTGSAGEHQPEAIRPVLARLTLRAAVRDLSTLEGQRRGM